MNKSINYKKYIFLKCFKTNLQSLQLVQRNLFYYFWIKSIFFSKDDIAKYNFDSGKHHKFSLKIRFYYYINHPVIYKVCYKV